MIAIADLHRIAREYVRAAKLLRTRKSYDAAVYLCGYAVKIALKARICRTLNWRDGFPETNAEFQDKGNLKTHDLQALLNFTSLQEQVQRVAVHPWSVVRQWRPEQRYNPIGTRGLADANDMIAATQILLRILI